MRSTLQRALLLHMGCSWKLCPLVGALFRHKEGRHRGAVRTEELAAEESARVAAERSVSVLRSVSKESGSERVDLLQGSQEAQMQSQLNVRLFYVL